MATTEERLKILNMIAEGKITAEDGAQLLTALKDAGSRTPPPAPGSASGEVARYLRVLVSGLDGRQKVNVNIPMNLVTVGLRMGARFAPEMDGLDVEDLMTAIRSGARGKIIDVTDNDSGEHVEIYVE